MYTIDKFVSKHGITMIATEVSENPNIDDMTVGSSHWKCVLKRGSTRMTTYFSKGPALGHTPPTAEELLQCLQSDAVCIDGFVDAEEFVHEMGYASGSVNDLRRGNKCYRAVVRLYGRLKRFLGDASFQELLDEVSQD